MEVGRSHPYLPALAQENPHSQDVKPGCSLPSSGRLPVNGETSVEVVVSVCWVQQSLGNTWPL